MKRDLKGYVRIDGSGRIVPGSLVLRRKAPANGVNGKFIQIQTYECCDYIPGAIQTITTPTLTTGQTYSVTFESNGIDGPLIKTGVSTPANLVTYLTTNYSANGTYVLSGTSILFTPVDPAITFTTAAVVPQSIALPTLTGGAPNYHVQFTNNGLVSADIDTGTITGATLVTYLTTNYAAQGTFVLNGTNVLFTPAITGTTLAITAGA